MSRNLEYRVLRTVLSKDQVDKYHPESTPLPYFLSPLKEDLATTRELYSMLYSKMYKLS